MPLIDGDPDSNLALWSFLFYGLSIVAGLSNAILLLVIPLSRTLRSRTSSLFIWSISFWYILNAGFGTPFGFYGKVVEESVPFGAPWLCQLRPFLLDVAFHIEIISLIVLASGFLDWLKNGEIPVDLNWNRGTGWLLCVMVWIMAMALSFPWSIPRYPKISNSTEGTQIYTCGQPKEAWFKWYSTIVAFCGGAALVIIADVIYIVLGIRSFSKSNANRLISTARSEVKALILILLKFNLFWIVTWVLFLIGTSGNRSILGRNATLISLSSGYLHDHVELWNLPILIVSSSLYRAAIKELFTCRIWQRSTDDWKSSENKYIHMRGIN